MERKFLITVLLITLIASLIAYITLLHRSRTSWQSVRVAEAITAVYGLGTVTSEHIYHLKVNTGKTVRSVPVIEGQQVQSGQTLLVYEEGLVVKAPFSGTITHVKTHPHELVNHQQTLLTLMDLKSRYILISLDQASISHTQLGMSVQFSFENIKEHFIGKISHIYPHDASFYVRVPCSHLPSAILPGMNADAAIIIKRDPHTVYIPEKALKEGNKVRYQLKGLIRNVVITSGPSNRGWVAVLSHNIPDHALVEVIKS